MNKAKYFLRSGIALLLSAAMTVNVSAVSIAAGKNDSGDDLTVFYVSPDGNDSGDGSLSAPFATISAARDAVRKINSDMSGNITVYLRGGDYRITEAIEFDKRDSATNGYRISYKAYPGETPVINGAKKVSGWTKYNDKLYAAPLDRDYKLRNLYVNDKRANMGSVREAQGVTE